MAADLAVKEPCRVATTGNLASLSTLLTVDGVALSSGDRVLVRAQTTTTQNGIYTAASGSWTRATDFDGAGEVAGGTQVFVTSGTRFAESAWRVSGNGAATPGSSAISFDPEFMASGTGTVPRSAALKLAEAPITPEDFGAAGDGHLPPGSATDDTAAVRAAMDAAVAEGRPLYLKNMYMVTDTIEWLKEGDSQAPIIFGDGRRTSGLKPYGVDGPVLRIDGSSPAPYKFAFGGWLHDFRIFPGFVNGVDRGAGFHNSGDNTTGIELTGFVHGCIERVEIHGLTGSAIVAPRRTELESPIFEETGYNSDGYQTTAEVKQCDLRFNGGWGVDGDAGFGCTLSLYDNYIIFNEKGGVRLGGGAWRIIRNGIGANGSPTHGGGGILVDQINGTPHTPEIYNNEIDGNFIYGIDLKACSDARIVQNRFNAHNAIWTDDLFIRPLVGVRAGFLDGSGVGGLQAEQNEFRTKLTGLELDTAFTAWQLDSGSSRIGFADIVKSLFTTSTANLTKYARGGGGRLEPVITAGVITGATVPSGFGGKGYSDTVPVVAVGGGGSGFAGTATLTGDALSGATISNGGSGYGTGTELVARPPELQGLNMNDAIRISETGYPKYTGGQVAFMARMSSGNIAAASASLSAKKIIFGTEVWDFAAIYDPTTGETTIPFPGHYLVSVLLRADLGAAGNVNLWAYVDGFEEIKETHRVDAAGDNSFTLSGIIAMGGVGQKLTIHADNSTGSAKATTGGAPCNRLSITLVG